MTDDFVSSGHQGQEGYNTILLHGYAVLHSIEYSPFSYSRLIKDHLGNNKHSVIEDIIVCLGKNFANSPTPQPRNGGLIGLAACAIALGKVGRTL